MVDMTGHRMPPPLGAVTSHATQAGGLIVTLTADTTAFRHALEQALAALAEIIDTPEWRHWARHHRPEEPNLTAMHAAYDQRRRARRRRTRR